MDMLTIASIARDIDVPESTARYYRDRFSDYIPIIGEGRNRRYTSESREVLRFIADLMRSGVPADNVESMLAARFPINATPQQQDATAQQQGAAILHELIGASFAELMETQGKALMGAFQEVVEANRSALTEEFTRQMVEQRQAHDEQMAAVLRELAEARQQIAATDDRATERDRNVTEALRALQESKKQPKSLFDRFFGK